MAAEKGSFVNRVIRTAVSHHWARAARNAGDAELVRLRRQRQKAHDLRHHLDELVSVADGRLALPMIGSNAFPRPHGTDWAWRPRLWREPLAKRGVSSAESRTRLGEDVSLFHDCHFSELTLRQLRNRREADLAPFGLRMDVFRFDGSFLSLVVDLPQEAMNGLTKQHLVRVDTIVETEKPLEIFARLNIKHGPNTEQIVRELPLNQSEIMVEFDLAYTNLIERRIEKAWLDLIFEGPEMNQVILRDLTLSRRPRSEF